MHQAALMHFDISHSLTDAIGQTTCILYLACLVWDQVKCDRGVALNSKETYGSKLGA